MTTSPSPSDSTQTSLPAATPDEWLAVLRILDANANRAQEGLRVVEEHARFVLDDRSLVAQLKHVRHALHDALKALPASDRLAARNTQGDVGAAVGTAAEYVRQNSADVAAANLARVQQALRAIEEYAKVGWPNLARQVEPLRYQLYVLAQALGRVGQARQRLSHARLYVLVDGGADADDFERRCRAVLQGGAHVVQLRDKRLDDRTLLNRARRLRDLTTAVEALFIMNDRPDLARLSRADGVHVGQEELPVYEARCIVGAEALVGVSTHGIEQARQAVLDGADYLGCGPTFPSSTKKFGEFPGLAYLQQVAAEIGLPSFAIGGISPQNVEQVLQTGITRIAVSDAVWRAADPASAAAELLRHLPSDESGRSTATP